MILALCNQNLIAPFTFVGACNRMVFETWLETCLLPTLEPGQVIVMDNATFHKGGCIQQLIQDAGCELIYLPPYSPDLNKIEKCWSWLKSQIRKKLEKFDCLRDAPLGCLTFYVLTAKAVAIFRIVEEIAIAILYLWKMGAIANTVWVRSCRVR